MSRHRPSTSPKYTPPPEWKRPPDSGDTVERGSGNGGLLAVAFFVVALIIIIQACRFSPLGAVDELSLPQECGTVEEGTAWNPIEEIYEDAERFWICDELGQGFWSVRSCWFKRDTYSPAEGRWLCRSLAGWEPRGDPADSATVWKQG